MTLSLDILAARMRQGESIPLGDTARVAVALSVPAICLLYTSPSPRD